MNAAGASGAAAAIMAMVIGAGALVSAITGFGVGFGGIGATAGVACT